jgi:hypothetical protein
MSGNDPGNRAIIIFFISLDGNFFDGVGSDGHLFTNRRVSDGIIDHYWQLEKSSR